ERPARHAAATADSAQGQLQERLAPTRRALPASSVLAVGGILATVESPSVPSALRGLSLWNQSLRSVLSRGGSPKTLLPQMLLAPLRRGFSFWQRNQSRHPELFSVR